MNPVPLLAKWSSICVWIKRKLLTPTGYLLLIHQHCSAGKGETKAEFIHRQELQSPNIKEIAWNFKKQLWPKCSNILYFQKSWEKDELSKKNKFHFNFCLNASKPKKKKKIQSLSLFPLLSARLGAPCILIFSHLVVKVYLPNRWGLRLTTMTAAQCFSKREVERLYPNILNLPHHHMVQKQTKQKLALKQMPLENSFFKIYTYTYHMFYP